MSTNLTLPWRRSAGAPRPDDGLRPWGPCERLGIATPRPGGPRATELLLEGLELASGDRVVEIFPGRGATARRILTCHPRAYIGIAPGPASARDLARRLRRDPDLRTLVTRLETSGAYTGVSIGAADATGLPDESASAVVAEFVLTAARAEQKATALREAARLLPPGGRLGLHELCLAPPGTWDPTADSSRAEQAADELAGVDAVLAPVTEADWREIVTAAGLVVTGSILVPVHPPTPIDLARGLGRIGPLRAMSLMGRIGDLLRLFRLAETLQAHRDDLAAIVLVAERPLVGGLRLPRARAE